MTIEEMNINIQRGIKFLDGEIPDWRSQVEKDTLDMKCNCIFRQLYGLYATGLIEHGLTTEDGIYYGLDTWDTNYSLLTNLWKDALK